MRKSWLATGLITLVAAGLMMGTVGLAHAATTPTPAAQSTPTPTTDPNAVNSAQATPSASTAASTDPNQLPAADDLTIKATCPAGIGPLAWIACPLINTATDAISKMAHLIVDFLKVTPLTQNNTLYTAWKEFLRLADVAFIIIFMVLIFSTLLSVESSSYQLKSLLPKLIAAAILVQFSYFITAIGVDIGNVLGAGVSGIFNGLAAGAPGVSGSHSVAQDILSGGIAGVGAVIAGFILGLPFILLMLGALFLGILGVFVTLAARQVIIALLVISSLAFAAWVLPNTSGYFKIWAKNLVRIILLYPFIIVILSVGGIITKAAQGTGTVSQVNAILASLVPIIAFFSIPATFKFAGSALNWLQGNYIMKYAKTASKSLRNSQLAKDMRATQREKGFLNQRDKATLPDMSKVQAAWMKTQRAGARLQAGQFGFGNQTTRRLASGYDMSLAGQMKDMGSIFDAQQWGNADLMNKVWLQPEGAELEYVTPGLKTKHTPITKAMRAQAIAQLGKAGGYLELARIQAQIFDQNQDNYRGQFTTFRGMPVTEVTDMWFRGLGASGATSQVIQALPSVNPGKKASAYDTLSAAQIINVHGSASPSFFKRIVAPVEPTIEESTILGKTVDSLRAERADRLFTSLVQISNSPTMAGKVDQQLVKRFRDAVIEGSQDIDPITGHATPMYDETFTQLMRNKTIVYQGETIHGDEFLRRVISPNGKFVSNNNIDEGEE